MTKYEEVMLAMASANTMQELSKEWVDISGDRPCIGGITRDAYEALCLVYNRSMDRILSPRTMYPWP